MARFPLNAPGDFFVEDDACMSCDAPEHEAPELMSHSDDEDGGSHCYFRRQPDTPEEVEHAIRACFVSCCKAVRYGGVDPKIIDRLEKLERYGWHPLR